MIKEKELVNISRRALKANFQICTHAIGDRANRTVINGYTRAFEKQAEDTKLVSG